MKVIIDTNGYWYKNQEVITRWFEARRQNGEYVLPELVIAPSLDCQCACAHCYELFDNKRLQDRLTTVEVKTLIDQFKAMDGRVLYFLSGEFLLREDALELIAYASERDICTSVATNGLILNEEKIKSLKACGLVECAFSLDSADPKEHDGLRGVPGCFDHALDSIRLVRKYGMVASIWTYVSKSKPDTLHALEQLAEDTGASYVLCFFPLLSGRFFNKPEENLSFEEREYYRRKYNTSKKIHLEFPTEESLCTGGGIRHVYVNPAGEVTFCPPVPYSYGNIKNEPLKDICVRLRQDFDRFSSFTGQCPVNNPEYRKHCNARLIVETQDRL